MKRIGLLCAVLLGLMATVGCEKKMVAPAAPPPPESILGESESLRDSLFKGDQAVLSDQDIDKILGVQLKLADRRRLAILSLDSFTPWSEAIADNEAKNFDGLLQTLKSSPQLTQVRVLPSLLIPEKRTVAYLREAAARIQADLLFVYTVRIQTFRQYRVFKPDEVRARCIAESVLLDVRTGIVVHTGRATESIELQKAPADLNFTETVARAESDARGKALLSLANLLTAHLADAAH